MMIQGGSGPPYATKDLVLVGGGHSHVGVLKMLAMARQGKPSLASLALSRTRVTLVAKQIHTPYSGMLPGYVAGHYDHDACHIDLAPLARLAGATLVHASATGLDLERRLVHIRSESPSSIADRPPVAYDVLSIDVGITPDMSSVPGARDHTTAVKPIDAFVRRVDGLLSEGPDAGATSVAVIGGGAGGIELTLALHHRLSVTQGRPCTFTLFTRSSLLQGSSAAAQRRFRSLLRRRNVRVVEWAAVTRVDAGRLHYRIRRASSPGEGAAEGKEGEDASATFDHCLWCTSAAAMPWLASSGLATDDRGFVVVNTHLQSTSHAHVFAAGDCATIAGHPRPKAGVFAVRQGAPLMQNLTRALLGGGNATPSPSPSFPISSPPPLVTYVPQSTYLSLVSTGDCRAVGLWGPLAFEGEWVWRLKHWIDTNWMAKYTTDVRR